MPNQDEHLWRSMRRALASSDDQRGAQLFDRVGVAQLVRAPGCGPGGRGFKSHHSPHCIYS